MEALSGWPNYMCCWKWKWKGEQQGDKVCLHDSRLSDQNLSDCPRKRDQKIHCEWLQSNGLGIYNLFYIYKVSGSELATPSKENDQRITALPFETLTCTEKDQKKKKKRHIKHVNVWCPYPVLIYFSCISLYWCCCPPCPAAVEYRTTL